MHQLPAKPHLAKKAGIWVCSGLLGKTMFEAYLSFMQMKWDYEAIDSMRRLSSQ